jgi:hypothetical protein
MRDSRVADHHELAHEICDAHDGDMTCIDPPRDVKGQQNTPIVTSVLLSRVAVCFRLF